jgi:hypothetical protein
MPHAGWPRHGGLYLTDLRPAVAPGTVVAGATAGASPPPAGHSWCFDVALDGAGAPVDPTVHLRFEGLATLPAGTTVVLIDRLLGQRSVLVDAGGGETVTDRSCLASRAHPAARAAGARFRLLVGDARWVAGALEPPPPAPALTVLHPARPNPFRPPRAATVIRYDLAEAGHVRLRAYDVTGKLVAVLLDAPSPAGRFDLAWSGRDVRGRRLAAGTYFLRLDTGRGDACTRKLVVVP